MRSIRIPERGAGNLTCRIAKDEVGSPCARVRPSGTRAGEADARGGVDEGRGGSWVAGAMTHALGWMDFARLKYGKVIRR